MTTESPDSGVAVCVGLKQRRLGQNWAGILRISKNVRIC